MTVGNRLKEWRIENKLKTTEIKEKTGISTGGFSDYENDKKLLFLGYTVLHFWGQDISKHTDECLQAIEEAIWDARFSDITTDYDISE